MPVDVGLPELQAVWVEGYRLADDDHVCHELESIETTNDPSTMSQTAEEFYDRFILIAEWDIARAMARVGLA
ncbi:MAG: hypothetical protein M0Z36_14560 [Thermaerobacter sp.]|nr:hypothetical protein [Thermaerobacter sp.]